jgi:monothiol glutaredoxin
MATIHVTDAARQAFEQALRDSGDRFIRLIVAPDFSCELSVGTPKADDSVVEHGPVSILVGPDSATRAEGVTIDYATRADGEGFVIDNPNRPRVKEISAVALKTVLDAGGQVVVMDARTPEERAVAMIAGSRLLDEEGYGYLLTLDRSTPIVFQCHHGVRSRVAAEHCLSEGFTNVFNLTGGIDAWSVQVDPKVPRY